MVTSEYKEYQKGVLRNSFPAILRHDLDEVFNILPFERTIKLSDRQFHTMDRLISADSQTVSLDGESLTIHNRTYFSEPNVEQEKSLNPLQRTILNCIFLRHHDGFVRQKRLEQILNSTDYFTTPFTFHLLGDYVLEILEVLNRHITDNIAVNYVKFINENKKYWQQVESRMTSYWNEVLPVAEIPKAERLSRNENL